MSLLLSSSLYAGLFDDVEEDSGPSFSKPASSFQASSGVKYYASTKNAQTVEHTNVSVDDTREDNTVDVQEYAEVSTKTSVTVLNNMGGSASVYGADKLESKTGDPVEKKGLVEIGYGHSARFHTGGTHIISGYKEKPEQNLDDEAKEKAEAQNTPRVLVS